VVGRVFAGGDPRASKTAIGAGFSMGLLPCLVLEVPLGGQETSFTRLLLPIAALGPLAIGAVRARVAFVQGAGRTGATSITVDRASSISPQVLAMIGSAAYGAVVVALYALFGGPNEAPLDIGSFGGPLLAGVAWVGLIATIGWFAMAGGAIAERLPRAAPVLRIVMLALLVGSGVTGAIALLGA